MKAINPSEVGINPLEPLPMKDDLSFVFVRNNQYWHKIAWNDVLYLQSDDHCVIISTEKAKYTLIASLTTCEKKLPIALFRRVHRSYIVNVSKINRLNKTEIIINDHVIPMTRAYADALFKDFVLVRTLG